MFHSNRQGRIDMAERIRINHRRNRQQTRRILADLRVHYRDLTRSSFLADDIDPTNHSSQMLVLSGAATIGGRY